MKEEKTTEDSEIKQQDLSQEEETAAVEKSDIEQLQEELKAQQDKYMLLLAEMENTRKRMQKEREGTIRFSVENMISEFLSPLDNLENALSFAHQTSEETQNWAKGFEMILAQFKEILETHQVVPFQSKGMPFDPHYHEVIEIEETEKYKEGMIIQEFVRGYKCGDRILRPARVKMAKNPPKQEEEKVTDIEQ